MNRGICIFPILLSTNSTQWWKGRKYCSSFSLLPAWIRPLSTPTFHSYPEHYPPPGPRMIFWKLKECAKPQCNIVFSLTPHTEQSQGGWPDPILFLLSLHPSSCMLSTFLTLGLFVLPLITFWSLLLTASHTELHKWAFGWNAHSK